MAREKNGNYGRALSKMEHFTGRQWCGYFTPCEMLELLDRGAVFTPGSTWDLWKTRHLAQIKKHRDIGICNPRWYSIVISQEIYDKLKERGQIK